MAQENQRFALVIGNSNYQDELLSKLASPDADVKALAGVLRDPQIGAFDQVEVLVNEPSNIARLAITKFFSRKKPDDLLVMYFSGHGVLDERGRLYLALQDTDRELLRGSALSAAFITDEMDNSRSKRQVLILDCCHSGAFARGSKGAVGASVGTGTTFEGSGYGRVVLTATDATQYAWEGDKIIGEAENSIFTHYLIRGLKTGAADLHGSGRITVEDLFDYTYSQVVQRTSKQTPGKWSYKQQGEIILAQNPHSTTIEPIDLPSELLYLIESPAASGREAAVKELSRLLESNLPGLDLSAVESLRQLANDDSRKVSTAASLALESYERVQRGKEHEQAQLRQLPQDKTESPPPAQERQERLEQEKIDVEHLSREERLSEDLVEDSDVIVPEQVQSNVPASSKSPLVAAILSFFLLGGGGQMYLGQWKKGLVMVIVVVLLIAFLLSG